MTFAKSVGCEAKTMAVFTEVRANEVAVNGYESRSPGGQNALDIFAGDWTSSLPLPEGEGLVAGNAPLFADPRVDWALEALGGVAGLRILELGPLEGGHSYMLDRAGAREVVAVEGNRRAFLRCLVIKEIFGLTRVRYLCGDFNKYLRETDEHFDVIFASGVLYHQLDPMQMLFDLGRLASAIVLWTHYHDAEHIAANAALAGRVGPLREAKFAGLRYSRAEYRYLEAVKWSGFCGGPEPQAHWLPRADILEALQAFGFGEISVAFDSPDHQNGPSFSVVAKKINARPVAKP